MKTSSCKSKGRRCSAKAKALMLKYCLELDPDDIVITSSGDTGEDLKLSPKARSFYPFSIECKNVEKLNVYKAYEQACGHGPHTPLLIHTKNRTPMFATLKFEDLLALMYWIDNEKDMHPDI